MKIGMKIFAVLFCLTIAAFTAVPAEATPLNDSTLVILKAYEPPVIDGQLDPIWYNAAEIGALRVDAANASELDDDYWWDCYPVFRVLWDEDNLYLYGRVRDDVMNVEADAVHEDDSFELFFDGGNDKTDGNYDAVNDFQFRFSYEDETNADLDAGTGNAGEPSFDPTMIEYAKMDTFYFDEFPGYTFEAAIPWSELRFTPIDDGTEIGFDVQYNDNDTGARDHMLRWWTTSNDAWFDASQFGNATLSEFTVYPELTIPKVNGTAPTVDATMEGAWSSAPLFSGHVFIQRQAGDYDETLWTDPVFLEDIFFDYKTLYDDEYFYLFVDVVDDERNVDGDASYNMDGIELYFDAGNTDGTQYDDGDAQYRWVYNTEAGDGNNSPVATNEEFAWTDTDLGYAFELKFPLDSLPQGGDYGDGYIFGFEVQVNDNDGGAREHLMRWWSDDNNSWADPSLFGTAALEAANIQVGVEDEAPGLASSFALEQNYPNPFNPVTTIPFTVPRDGHITLTVHNILGEKVATLVDGFRTANQYEVNFNGVDLSSGIYFYTLKTTKSVQTKRMVLLK